jgi:GTPase KRas protein
MITELKIVIFGSGGVGKSAITIQFINNAFVEVWDPTIEDGYLKQIVVDGNVYTLNIIDTSGQEEYKLLRDQYIVSGDGFILVYSIIDKKTFEEIENFKKYINKTKDSNEVPMILCGNKSDLSYMRKVSVTEGNDLARSYDCPFFECSAKIAYNIDEIWSTMVREIMKKRNQNMKLKKRKRCLIL